MEILKLEKTIFHTNEYNKILGNFPRRINVLDENDFEMIEFALNQSNNLLLYSNFSKSEKEKNEFNKNSFLIKLRALIWLYVGEDLFIDFSLLEPIVELNNFSEWKEQIIKNATEFAKDIFEYKIMNDFITFKKNNINLT